MKTSDSSQNVILDLGQVKGLTPPLVEILHSMKKAYAHVSLKSDPSPPSDDPPPAAALPDAAALEQPASEEVSYLAAPRAVLMSLRQRVDNFFLLLSDTLFHTARYLRTHEGIYPGEILNQLNFMAYGSFPIVSLITFLVGVTISLTSAAQLKLFGADLYLPDFVGIAMFRELVPLMVGVILAGKIGAAITAEIASMTVLEEVDALKTMGIVPEKYLMVPRFIAITLAMPMLVALADIMGILGGILVANLTLGIPPGVFLHELFEVVFFKDFMIGMLKAQTFGWVVVISSGYKGFYVKRSAEEVGRATTESVVLSISLIIVIDCIYALILYQ
ncbi:MAG: ABC transporter permease [Candidatus Aminicenantaceae bacterium]